MSKPKKTEENNEKISNFHISTMDVNQYARQQLSIYEHILNEVFCVREFYHTTQVPDFNYTYFGNLEDWIFDENLKADKDNIYYLINESENKIIINPIDFVRVDRKSVV